MSLIKITAWFSCDGCGTQFNIDLDPANKHKDWSLMDEAEDALIGDIQHSMLNDMHLCKICTLKSDTDPDYFL